MCFECMYYKRHCQRSKLSCVFLLRVHFESLSSCTLWYSCILSEKMKAPNRLYLHLCFSFILYLILFLILDSYELHYLARPTTYLDHFMGLQPNQTTSQGLQPIQSTSSMFSFSTKEDRLNPTISLYRHIYIIKQQVITSKHVIIQIYQLSHLYNVPYSTYQDTYKIQSADIGAFDPRVQ